jgi:microcystin-dependent protein
VGWALCHGQTLAIAPNTALFAIIGTTYGGNGVTTFNLPDLRGRVPICFGQGPGLPLYSLGETGGEVTHTLAPTEMPQHTHQFNVSDVNGTQSTPAGAFLARDPSGSPAYGASAGQALHPAAVSLAGSSFPHNNMQPYLTLTWCIATQGIFPSRP